jgi:hypothetical protein
MTPARQHDNPSIPCTSGRHPHRVTGRTAERHSTRASRRAAQAGRGGR